MATTLSFSISLHFVDSFKPHKHKQTHIKPKKTSFSATTKATKPAVITSLFQDPFRKTKFLSNQEHEKLKQIDGFDYRRKLQSGSVFIRAMRAYEIDETVKLLAQSFAESMFLPGGGDAYLGLLMFLIKDYLIERRGVMPNAVMLVGFFRESGNEDGGEECLAGTVEVSFNKFGANASPPTPFAPIELPYVCNMNVAKSLRRRGIGWHLLKAGEELISQMSSSREIYLHCRMIDQAPLNMYIKADYSIVKTDNILILLTLQRRKHLMRKELPVLDNPPKSDVQGCNEEVTS